VAERFRRLAAVIEHPGVRIARRVVRAVLLLVVVLLAASLVTAISVDLGPSAKKYAEKYGSQFLERPLHIGRIRFRLFTGNFLFEDLTIEGITPQSRPFLTAKRVELAIPWSTLVDKRFVLRSVEMTDWDMYVEVLPNGKHSLPRLTPKNSSGRKSSWTTTLEWVHAYRGSFTFEDHAAPWSVITRNLDVTVAKPSTEYRGQASFSNGMVAIGSYVPFSAAMRSSFKIDGSRVLLDRIDLITDGAHSSVHGDVNLKYWPEQSYKVESTFDLKRMRELFFAHESFALAGNGRFSGYFHLFKEPRPDGTNRTGRELVGTVTTPHAGVRASGVDYQFDDVNGMVRWTPEKLSFTDATTSLYGGRSRFSYEMAPLGVQGVRPTARFSADYDRLSLGVLTDFAHLEGLRLAGDASGRFNLRWPLGRFSARAFDGTVHVTPPPGVTLMTRRVPVELIAQGRLPRGPGVALTSLIPLAVGADLSFSSIGTSLTFGPSTLMTERTYMEIEGATTMRGEDARLPFFVASADWQESDRVFAQVLTALGSPTAPIEIAGYGTFQGVLLNDVRKPRIEGTFDTDHMRAWDVDWGAARGRAIIENSYADVREATITGPEGRRIDTDGRFSLGFPRKDGGEELNARVLIHNWPISVLRHAFELDRYPVDGIASGEFHVFGNYRAPLGYGTMEVENGSAYGESFESATASVGLEGNGVRLTGLDVAKSTGRGNGAAFVTWDGTYSFDFEGTEIPVEAVALASKAPLPLTGRINFNATGSGTFDRPQYTVRGKVLDLFAADEGIGDLAGTLGIDGNTMMVAANVASKRLAVNVQGQVELAGSMFSDLTFAVTDTSLDPYVRAFNPNLSPYTTAVVDGTVHVRGELMNFDALQIDTTVDRLDLRLFDYPLRNKAPFKVVFDRNSISIPEECPKTGADAPDAPSGWCGLTLTGEDAQGRQTELQIGGFLNSASRQIIMTANGTADLAILQGFVSNVKSSGTAVLKATVTGDLDDPTVSGTLRVENGRIRHFSAPQSIDNINGTVSFDTRGVTLDGLTGRLGEGPVTFGGRIDKMGLRPGRLEVTITGRDMRLRYPQGMQSKVDADLTLQGTIEDMRLGGDVMIRDALYSRDFPRDVFDLLRSDQSLPGAPGEEVPLTYDDIHITSISSIRVQNQGVNNAHLSASADLNLNGTYDRPVLSGDLEIDPGGEVQLLGKRYTFTRGTIYFANPNENEPSLDLELESRVRVPGETYRITADVTGTWGRLKTPLITFTSDPSLSKSEIVALLFGDIAPGQNRELARLGDQGTQTQQILQELAAKQTVSPITSQVSQAFENALGVDSVQITPSLANPNPLSSRLEPCAHLQVLKRVLAGRGNLTYSRSQCSNSRDEIISFEYDATDRYSWVLSRNEDQTYAIELRVRTGF
jgi:hypothetical protein